MNFWWFLSIVILAIAIMDISNNMTELAVKSRVSVGQDCVPQEDPLGISR